MTQTQYQTLNSRNDKLDKKISKMKYHLVLVNGIVVTLLYLVK